MAVTITMKYVQSNVKGRFRYRRRVPEILVPLLGKKEFVKVIGRSENEALSNYGSVHGHFERLLKLARSGVTGTSTREQQELLRTQLKAWGNDPNSSGLNERESEMREIHADRILSKYPEDLDTGRPIGVSEEDSAIVGALLQGAPKEKSKPTITDAFKFYLQEHPVANEYKRKKQIQRFNRVELHLIKVVNEDKLLSEVTRGDVRALRDTRIANGVSLGTIKREFNDIRAVFNFAISELDVDVSNPFVGIVMPKEAVANQDKRKPLDPKVIEGVYSDLENHKLLLQLWTLLDLTGARLAEVAGLMGSDFVLDHNIPHIHIRPTDDRRLKTAWSHREVPLLGKALEIGREIASTRRPEEYAFGKHGPVAAHDNLGAALNKRIRNHTKDPKQVTHSLRHNMKDRLRNAEVFPETAKAIQGHAPSKGVDAGYGSGVTLEKKLEALLKINGFQSSG